MVDDELRFRTRMVPAGVWITYALAFSAAAWIAFTWRDEPHRPLMAALVALGCLSGLLVGRLPHERIVAGRWREAFFVGWSALTVVFISLVAIIDGGVTSPVVSALVLTLIYAALSYPLASVLAVCGLDLLAFLAVFALGGDAPTSGFSYLWMYGTTLTMAGGMCLWGARLQGDLRAELARLSRADPLTGALNRRGFAERLEARLREEDPRLALVLLDLDGFKAVNDTHGHAAGDELLRWVVAALEGLLRPADAVGRLGGDEFAILLPGVDAEGAAGVAERVRATLGERVGASAGVAVAPHDGGSAEALHRHADLALYAAKREREKERAPLSG